MKIIIITTLLFCSTALSVTAQNYVIFFAYPRDNTSKAGHTFVAFVRKDNNLQQTLLDGKWGFYPTESNWKALFKVKGQINDEWKVFAKPEMQDFVVEVKDKAVYDECLSLKNYWDGKSYSVVAKQTCVGFVRDIAAKIPELTIPNAIGGVFPAIFLNNLRQANREIDTQSRISLSSVVKSNPVLDESENSFTKPISNPLLNANLIGGATPEELGKILLKALKTNDQQTWGRTVLTLEPTMEGDRNNYEEWAEYHRTKRFLLVRQGLEGQGVTDWNSVVFSRVVYDSSPFNSEKRANGVIVEFIYKEFVGDFSFVTFSFKNGKYYVDGVQPRMWSKGNLRRNSR